MKLSATKQDAALIEKIADRAKTLYVKLLPHDEDLDMLSLLMDITACHLNGMPLRLEELLTTDDGNFGHDVFGIRRFINRKTGRMTDHFVPRFAYHERKNEAGS